jgi:hypothetical protein
MRFQRERTRLRGVVNLGGKTSSHAMRTEPREGLVCTLRITIGVARLLPTSPVSKRRDPDRSFWLYPSIPIPARSRKCRISSINSSPQRTTAATTAEEIASYDRTAHQAGVGSAPNRRSRASRRRSPRSRCGASASLINSSMRRSRSAPFARSRSPRLT